MNGKRVGLYLRVSTDEQTVENQRQALLHHSAHFARAFVADLLMGLMMGGAETLVEIAGISTAVERRPSPPSRQNHGSP